MKKKFLLLTVILALFLSACSAPLGITSPSLHNPTDPANQSGSLNRASDYNTLIKLIQKAQANRTNYPTRMYFAGEKATNGAPTDADTTHSGTANTDYSKTNIQVAGVDEADIIKTDGQYLFVIANNRLYIVDAGDPANLKVVATTVYKINQETETTVSGESPMEMYLDVENNRLTLIVSGWINEKITQPVETKPVETKPEETVPTETKPVETSDVNPSEPTSETVAPPDAQPTATGETTPGSADGSAPASSGGSEGLASEPASGTVAESTDTAADGKMLVDRIWYPYFNQKQYTTTFVFDISDRANPTVVRQFSQTGYYMTSRKIGAAVYVVTNQYQYRVYATAESGSELKPQDIFPATCDETGTVSLENWEVIPADQIAILPNGDASNQMVLAAIDTRNDTAKPDLLAVLGSSGTVYASTDYLYVAAFNYIWDGRENSIPEYTTDIFRFKLAGAQISEAGKGSVPGSILNQFSMDEYNGYFRIATTVYGWQTWPVAVDDTVKEGGTATTASVDTNNVYVLDASLKVVGKVENLAPGEQIKSVRFMGDQAYVVTFRNVDPLFVIDLASPASPKVLGQLKIPGYSTYLHPYKEGMLLGFGYDVKTEGESAYNMGLKVSLFDISDFANPREVSSLVLGGRGSFADILYNHKTLLFSLEKNLIAFPATLVKSVTQNSMEYGQPIFQGLLVLEVDENNQLRLRGGVTHFDKLSDPNGEGAVLKESDYNAFFSFDTIYRGAWIGDTLYTYSNRMIRSFNLETLTKLGEVELPGYKDNQTYYYGGDVVRTAVSPAE
jgi:inhibitor of cysteine peptidase